MSLATAARPVGRALAPVAAAVLLALLPWLEGGASPSGLFLTHTVVFILAGLALATGLLEGRLVLGAGWEAPASAALIGAAIVSMLMTDYLYGPWLSVWNGIVAVMLAGALLILGAGMTPLCSAVVALTCAAQALAALLMPAQPNMTPSGSFANGNQLAAYLNIGIFVALTLAARAWRERQTWRAGAAVAAALLDIAAVLRTGSRGALLALLAVGAISLYAVAPRGDRRLRLALWGVLIALGMLAAGSVAWRFARIGDPYRFDRVRIWKAGLEAARDHPVLGLGPGMFERRGYRYNFPLDREMFRFSKMPSSTHSTWLQTLAETGLAGLAAAIWLAAAMMARLLKRRGAAAAPAMALGACLLQSVVDTPFEVPAVTLSLIALAAPALAARDPQDAPLWVGWSRPPRGRASIPAWPALGVAIATAWLGAVLFPYIAWTDYTAGRLDAAIGRDAYNPLYLASRAEAAAGRARPLDPPALASAALDLDEAHRLDPGNPEYLLQLAQLHARACFELGADAAAAARVEELYDRVLALGSKDPRPRLDLALFMLAQGKGAGGIAQLRSALEAEPRFLTARLALVKALIDAGQTGQAAEERGRLRRTLEELASYQPKNGYERDLMRIDPRLLAEVDSRLR